MSTLHIITVMLLIFSTKKTYWYFYCTTERINVITNDLDSSKTANVHLISVCIQNIFILGYISLQPYLCVPDNTRPEVVLCQTVDRDLPLTYVTITVEITNPIPTAGEAAPNIPCGDSYT